MKTQALRLKTTKWKNNQRSGTSSSNWSMFNKEPCPFHHDPASNGTIKVWKNLYLQSRLQQTKRDKVESKIRAEKSLTKDIIPKGAHHVNRWKKNKIPDNRKLFKQIGRMLKRPRTH